MAVEVASGTALDQCPVLYLLLAWRDLLVVLASTKVRMALCLPFRLLSVDRFLINQ